MCCFMFACVNVQLLLLIAYRSVLLLLLLKTCVHLFVASVHTFMCFSFFLLTQRFVSFSLIRLFKFNLNMILNSHLGLIFNYNWNVYILNYRRGLKIKTIILILLLTNLPHYYHYFLIFVIFFFFSFFIWLVFYVCQRLMTWNVEKFKKLLVKNYVSVIRLVQYWIWFVNSVNKLGKLASDPYECWVLAFIVLKLKTKFILAKSLFFAKTRCWNSYF